MTTEQVDLPGMEPLQPNQIYVIYINYHQSYWANNPAHDRNELHGFGGPSAIIRSGRSSDWQWWTCTRDEKVMARLRERMIEIVAKNAWVDQEAKDLCKSEYTPYEKWVEFKVVRERYEYH